MSRGNLDRETALRIDSELPNVIDVRKSSLQPDPSFISLGFPVGSTLPQAAVCLQDATSTLAEARYALLEAIAHLIWYREKSEPLNEKLALYFGKFYADDVALRVYAAGEHLANAIENIIGIKNEVKDFKETKLRGKNVTSKQAIVGMYLSAILPNHEITKAIISLRNSEDWRKTKKYRDDWVHNKPPIIKGLGVNYERRNRLIVTATTMGVTFGSGDEAEFSVDDLLAFMKPSLFLLTDALAQIGEYFRVFLDKNQKAEL